MAFHVTQCPGCESTFNTSARLLESAAGKVRCGSCLTVFEAMQNFVEQDHLLAPNTPEDSVFVGNNPQDYFDPSSFLTRSALTEDVAEPVFADTEIAAETRAVDPEIIAGQAEPRQSDSRSDSQPEDADTQQLPQQQQPSEESQEPDPEWKGERLTEASGNPVSQDSPWSQTFQESREIDYIEATFSATALSEQSDDKHPEAGFQEALSAELEMDAEEETSEDSGKDTDAAFLFSVADEIEDEFGIAESFEEIASDIDPDNSPTTTAANDVLEPEANTDAAVAEFDAEAITETVLEFEPTAITATEPELESEPTAITATEPELESETAAASVAETELESELAPAASEPIQKEADSTAAIRARALDTELRDEKALEAIPAESLALLRKVSTPVELLASKETRWLRQLLLGLSMVLLATVLTAQLLWQRMENYSQLTQIRPFYALGCQWLNCELPVYSDIDAIRSDNLVVRSHPERSNALLINVEFRNSANFPQLFPILILSFNTATNDVVAIREFSPAGYLDPGLQSILLMPVQAPVQISLELIDPGPNAVNYTLAFRRPSTFN
jgi:predicted Zn finger-like uncharacterized protein